MEFYFKIELARLDNYYSTIPTNIKNNSYAILHRLTTIIRAKQNFLNYTPRDKSPKRKGIHKKSLSKGEKLNKKLIRYKGGGR